MINNENSVSITSDVIFDYLLNHKTMISIYLEDGTTLTGQVLGRDGTFLLIMEKTVLRMIQIAKISHLQADVSFAIEDLPGQLRNLKPQITSTANCAINGGSINGGSINGGAINAGATQGGSVNGGPSSRPDASTDSVPKPEEQSTKELFKTRLDQLVRNW